MDEKELKEAEQQSSGEAEKKSSASTIGGAGAPAFAKSKMRGTLMPYLLIILGIVILGALAYGYWQYKSDSGLNLFGHKYGGKSVATTTTATTGTTATGSVATPGSTAAATTGTTATGSVATPGSTAAADWKTETNTIYSYSLTLNDVWLGYKASTTFSTSFETAFIHYYMPTTDASVTGQTPFGKQYSNIFSILVFTPEQWATVQAGASADALSLKADCHYINKNTNYVFTYITRTGLPSDLAAKNFKISDVVSSFKFTTEATANWQVTRSLEYPYIFKYPTDWMVRDLTEANTTLIPGMLSYVGSSPKTVGEDSFLLIEVNSHDLNTIVAREKKIIADNPNEELVSESQITKFGVSATKIDIRNKTTLVVFTKYIMSKNSTTYVLNGESTDTTAIANTANLMVDTFQFTN